MKKERIRIPMSDRHKSIGKGKWVPKRPCMNRNHNPPGHLYIRPGETHIHICPGCGKETVMSGGPATYLSV